MVGTNIPSGSGLGLVLKESGYVESFTGNKFGNHAQGSNKRDANQVQVSASSHRLSIMDLSATL
jgi:hypothetical protein